MGIQTFALTPDTSLEKTAYLTFNLNQAAGTYALGTVSGGDVLITRCAPYNAVAATGLVSAAINTDDTGVTTILAAAALATLTGGLNLTLFNAPFVLPSGKHINGVIVGTGTGGSIKVAVAYRPLAAGAVIS